MFNTTTRYNGNHPVTNFRNTGDLEINDVIHDEVFDLDKNNYSFTLQSKTNSWRFGIRLFNSEEIPFSINNRHIQEGNIDIHLAVGTWNKPPNLWENPSRIELVQYNVEFIDHVIDRFDQYPDRGTVEFAVGRDVKDLLNVVYNVGDYRVSQNIHVPSDFRYFKLFAWADKISFDIDCIIHRNTIEASISEFYVGDVKFKKADLFNDEIIAESDLIVLPCSSSGSTISSISNVAKQLNISLPSPDEAGEVKVIVTQHPDAPPLWGWAYSVDASQHSSIPIIRNVLKNLLRNPDLNSQEIVSIPLLGTGAGGLDFLEVAILISDTVASTETDLTFIVVINNKEWFEKIQVHFNTPDAREDNEVLESNEFLFRDKVNVDPVLNVKDIAAESFSVINGIPASENEGMVGVFGKWGRGKTYLMKQIWKFFSDQQGIYRIDFHAWKYQDTPAIWAYLFEQFATKFYSINENTTFQNKKHLLRRYKRCLTGCILCFRRWRYGVRKRLTLNFHRLGLSSVWYFVIPLSFSFYFSFNYTLTEKISLLFSTSLFSVVMIYYSYGKTAKSLLKQYFQRISFFKLLGIQAEVQKELRNLLNTWVVNFEMRKIILYVEDIDRCSENRIIEIIDALRVMLDDSEISSKVIVVTAIDEGILKMAIRHKYSKLVSPEEDMSLIIKEYLDKLFIVGLRLGPLSKRERDEYFIELTKKDRQFFDVSPFKSDEIVYKKGFSNDNAGVVDESNLNEKKRFEEVLTDSASKGIQRSERIPNIEVVSIHQKIAEKEFQILRRCLLNHSVITPRQIRIFYFRYVIAKNLLVRVYGKNKLNNKWARAFYCEIFINLLIKFSELGGRELLDKHKIKVLESRTGKSVVFGTDTTIPTADYREVLKVLDVVIAY